MEIEKLIEALGDLERCAYGYHINGEVLGMDCTDFERLMVDAAEEISKIPALQAENERLQAELEKEEAARKKQADILYELRGQKYEQTTAIDQLRAENDRLKAQVPRWIPVEEMLPEEEGAYIVYVDGEVKWDVYCMFEGKERWFCYDGRLNEFYIDPYSSKPTREPPYPRVTHWMALPEAPKEEKKDD